MWKWGLQTMVGVMFDQMADEVLATFTKGALFGKCLCPVLLLLVQYQLAFCDSD